VVDDAELVDDPTGAIGRLVASRRPGLLVIAAGRPESLRAAYGHWTAGVRRSRLGVVMAGATDMDADLLGATLPRWSPIAPRPGLAHLVADGTEVLVQCALEARSPGFAEPAESAPRAGLRRRSTPGSLVAVS
jgi:S-DNA-T family DNA segregation ATPase FtsK/SpoIIIE